MRLNEVVYTDAKPVEGYSEEGFRVGGEIIRGHVLCGPTGTGEWQGWDDSAALEALAGQVDVLFVGTGAEIAHMPAALRTRLEAAGLGVEVMATAPACRTYNVLLSEGRRIALAALRVA
ncbi:Mth938-like domain-containing protein [Primorskyibacter sp. S187A]|uniref:Mth938-like domain-containing protein n=1 Tax=Primorskyibacter sp. S187A TaxID=3415130 RepID=UPI003C79CCD9